MSNARLVPVTVEMDGEELDAGDAWHTVRRVGFATLLRAAFVRFRLGDGLTSSRALALQAALAVVPLMLALTGLATYLRQRAPAQVIAHTIQAVSPGSARQDALTSAVSGSHPGGGSGALILGLGLVFALVAMTSAIGQVETGTNRIYGIRQDRPAPRKFTRAAGIAVVLAVPVSLGFLLFVAGGAFAEAMTTGYHWDEAVVLWWNILRWPAGVLLLVFSISVLLDHMPRRRQPQLSWLALGAGTAVVLTLAATGLLAVYVKVSPSFGDIYGPLAGVFALLLWSLFSAMALFYGAAVCAQLEAIRARQPEPAYDDPGPPARQRG